MGYAPEGARGGAVDQRPFGHQLGIVEQIPLGVTGQTGPREQLQQQFQLGEVGSLAGQFQPVAGVEGQVVVERVDLLPAHQERQHIGERFGLLLAEIDIVNLEPTGIPADQRTTEIIAEGMTEPGAGDAGVLEFGRRLPIGAVQEANPSFESLQLTFRQGKQRCVVRIRAMERQQIVVRLQKVGGGYWLRPELSQQTSSECGGWRVEAIANLFKGMQDRPDRRRTARCSGPGFPFSSHESPPMVC